MKRSYDVKSNESENGIKLFVDTKRTPESTYFGVA